MVSDFKNRLADHVYRSCLSDEQKLVWSLFIKRAEASEHEAVFEAVSESQENLLLLTEHLHDKVRQMRAART